MPLDQVLDTAAHAVAAEITSSPPRCGSTRVVAVDGPSGSGKTTLADRVVELTGASLLRLEGAHRGWRGLDGVVPLLADALGRLSRGEPASLNQWDWVHDRPGTTEVGIEPAPVLVVDGVGSGAAAIRPFLSLLVWVEADQAVRHDRAMSRDGDTYRPWWDVWADQERHHFSHELTRDHADLVVAT